jgi:hypothetical protein
MRAWLIALSGLYSPGPVEGAKEGFGSGPIGMSPETEQSLVNAGVLNVIGQARDDPMGIVA